MLNVFNALNFFYNFSMVRLLTAADYGILAALMALVAVFNVIAESIQTVLSKYSAQENSRGKLKNLLRKSTRKAFRISFYLFIAYAVLAVFLSHILNIAYSLVILSSLTIFLSLLLPVTRGVFQGKKRFYSLGFNTILEGAIKLGLSIFLVYLGFRVYGALIGVIIGALLALLFSYISLRDIYSSREEYAGTPEIYSYSKPVILSNLAIILFLSLDIILAKLFFSPEAAGAYAISSTIAKILFIGTQPISRAMFPLSVGAKKQDSQRVFFSSLALLIGIGIAFLAIVYFSPEMVIKIYSGRILVESISVLFLLSLGAAALGLANLVILYKLSRGAVGGYFMLPLFVVVQVVLGALFHDSLISFSIAMVLSSVTFLLGCIFILRNGKAVFGDSGVQ